MTVRVRTSHAVAALAGALLATAFLGACKPKDPETPANQGAGGGWNNNPPPQGGYGNAPPAQGGYANAPPAQGGYANGPQTTTTGPATTTAPPPPPPPTATTPPAPIDPTVLQALLTPLAQKSAPGAKPDGPPVSGMVQQGTPLTANVVIAASGTKCYTAIGVAGPGVTDLVVELWATPPPPLPPTMMSTSQGSGVSVVMAGAPNCFKNLLPIPVPGTLKVTARAGAGPVLAQLYSKLACGHGRELGHAALALPSPGSGRVAPVNAVFVAGATGYTGREVVRIATARGARTIAHVRPDSNRLAEWAARFGQMGAEVDTTPWDARAMGETLARLSPSAVLALLGTTASRGKKAGSEGKAETYETVDYALTAILIDAARGCSPPPRFLYLSSAGVAEGTTNAYLAARVKAEAKLRASGLPYRIARPSFITGDDREEARPMERVGASLANGALSLVGALGGRRLRDRYRSTTATVLAAALVRLALDDAGESRVLESEALRA